MSRARRLLQRIVSTIRRDAAEDDLSRELNAHLELMVDDLVQRGTPPDEARRLARKAFGSIEQTKDAHRDTRALLWLEQARQDAAYAWRALLRQPSFAAAAIGTLALGIGAATAIFSVAYGVAIRPLPYPADDRLIRIYESNPASGQPEHKVSNGAFHAWREGAPSIESAALFGGVGTRFLTGPEPTPVAMRSVSPGFFDVLGVKPLLGPGFRPEREYTRFTADDEVVISFELWQRLFGGRPDIIGRTLSVVGVAEPDEHRIVGVMPKGFVFDAQADAWRPTLIVELPIRPTLRRWRYDSVVARLRSGTTIENARAELETVAAQLAREFPATNAGWTVTVKTLKETVVGNFGRATWLLVAGVLVVLLVAAVNVSALLVARALSRERETAVRAALGAGTTRLVRLWTVEAGVLSACGGALGLLLAWLGVRTLRAAAPPGLPRLDAIALDWPVLALSLAATTATIVAGSLASLVVPLRRDLLTSLRVASSGSGESRSRQLLRAGLTAAQCAGAAILLVLAVMLTRSFANLMAVDLGWQPGGMLSLFAEPPTIERRPWAIYVDWSDRLIERLRGTPGIENAAVTSQVPLSAQTYSDTIAKGRGKSTDDTSRWTGVRHSVSDGYFVAMGIRLLEGRHFEPADRFTAAQHVGDTPRPEEGVAIISATTARSLWPGETAVGKLLWLPNIDTVEWRRVVGVVEDIQFHRLGEPPVAHVFIPWTQMPTGNPRLLVRGRMPMSELVPLVRRVVQEVAPGTRVDQVMPLEGLADRATAQPRFTSRVVALFGLAAVVLAAVGVNGTLACTVRARRREIGVRMALGATILHITRRTIVTGVVPALLGSVVGAFLAVSLARSFEALLFGLDPLDPMSILAGVAVLLAAALAAAAGPARYAAKVDPVQALRAD